MVNISNEVMDEVPQLAQHVEKSKTQKASDDTSEFESGNFMGSPDSSDKSSSTLLCFCQLFYILHFLI